MATQVGGVDDGAGLAASLLPFFGGYVLSHLIGTSNATMSGQLVAPFGLDPRGLVMLTSVCVRGAAGFGLALDVLASMSRRILAGLGTPRPCLVASGSLGAVAATIPQACAAEATPFLALAAMFAVFALASLNFARPTGASKTGLIVHNAEIV